jgi:DNA replication and repair protein RecF
LGLQSVQVDDFRCISRAQLELDSQLTLITGPNGSGKSTLLEAIFLLGRGRSFRTTQLQTAIRHGTERLRVVGVVNNQSRRVTIGVEFADGSIESRIAGTPAATLAELALAFPVQVIDPGVHKLIEEGPVGRRRYLDWGVFHVEHAYLGDWQRFQRVLKQRNAALRTEAADELLDAFDQEFAVAGEAVAAARARYAETLVAPAAGACLRLLGEPVQLRYGQGWPDGIRLEEALAVARPRDRRRSMSTVGPHRADFIVERLGGPARVTVSRGQQKLVAAGLILGQLQLHADAHTPRTTLLLDDPAAELDAISLERLVGEVGRLPTQLVMTALAGRTDVLGRPGRRFHVEQGVVSPVI